MSTHTKWLEAEEVYVSSQNGGSAGVSEAEAIERAREAENDAEYNNDLASYEQELENAVNGVR